MCNFLSAVFVRRNKTLEILCDPEHTNSHSEIIAAAGLKDDESSYYRQHIAKCELIPPAGIKDVAKLSKWNFRVDESETPEWLDIDKARDMMERQVASMFIKTPKNVLLGGCYILTGKKAKLEKLVRGRIVMAVNGADLSRADLSRADLSRANLTGANLTGADLTGADLTGANLTDADLSRANLTGADLSRADLSRADLFGADLSRANLFGADLSRADLTGADLSRANLFGADLSRANLSGANLTGANLSRANLTGANLTGANLSGANFTNAYGYTLPSGWKLDQYGEARKVE